MDSSYHSTERPRWIEEESEALGQHARDTAQPLENFPLKSALELWEAEVENRLSELAQAAADVEETSAKHSEAQKRYRNLYRKAETEGIIKTIGKTALREAGIPTPPSRRRKRKTPPSSETDSSTNSPTLE